MNHRRGVHASPLRRAVPWSFLLWSGIERQFIPQKARRAGEREFRMIADQHGPRPRSRCRGRHCELARDDRARARLQSRSQMFLIIDEDNILCRRRFHAGHSAQFDAAIPHQPGPDRIRNLCKRALHRSHCIAAGRTKGSVRSGNETKKEFSRRRFGSDFATPDPPRSSVPRGMERCRYWCPDT